MTDTNTSHGEEPSQLWLIEDSDECYTDDDIDGQIATYLDWMDDEDLPAKITLTGMRQMAPRVEQFSGFSGPLERLVNDWCEEYGEPHGDNPDITKTMIAAEREFIATVLAELQPHVYQCERTGVTREIDVLDWARENEEESIVRILEARNV